MNFLEIVNFLAQANILDKKIIPIGKDKRCLSVNVVLKSLIFVYFIFIMHIYFSAFVDIPWFDFSRVIEIQNLIIGFSALVFISLLLLITYKAEEEIIKNGTISTQIFSYIKKMNKTVGRDEIMNGNKEINNGEQFDNTNLYILYGDSKFPKKRRLSLFGIEEAVIRQNDDKTFELTDAGKKLKI